MAEYDYDEPYVVIERQSGSTSSFLFGLAIGAGFALLFAPQSGDETRRELRRRARKMKRVARETAAGLSDQVLDTYQHAVRTVEDKLDDARQAIELKKQQASRAVQAGREAAQQARDDLERRITETKAAYQAGADVGRSRRPVRTARGAEDLDDDLDEPIG